MPTICNLIGNRAELLVARRHRGARLTTEARGEKSRFSCPFHAWTYAADGRPIGLRAAEQFCEVDRKCSGLIELPSVEKSGLRFVHPKTDGEPDIDGLLGAALANEPASREFGACVYQGESVLDMPLNRKIANDTFGEVYHFTSLHKHTLTNLLHGAVATGREYGRHHRICPASKYINVYQADISGRLQFDISARMERFVSTDEHEDYLMGTKTRIEANSGKIPHFLFGRNEPALLHFHNNCRTRRAGHRWRNIARPSAERGLRRAAPLGRPGEKSG